MKRHNLTPEDLLNNQEFELIDQVDYSDLKAFVIKEIGCKSLIIRIYSIVQVLAVTVLTALTCYYIFGYIYNDTFKTELKTIAITLIFSFTLLIVIHELIHAAAFRLLGKKDIGFGVQLRKYLFYTESNREVLSRKEMLVVALAPFTVISLVGIALYIFVPGISFSLAGLIVFLVHLFFCSGDLAIVSYFYRQRPTEIYTFDDRKEKRSYYFRKIE
jgi:hypothetical protein